MKKVFTLFLSLGAILTTAGETCFPEQDAGYGICANITRWEWPVFRTQLARARELGVNYLRADFDWTQVEPEPGRFNWSRWDSLVEGLRKHNIRAVGILGSLIPDWAKPFDFKNAQHREMYMKYMRACIERYKNDIRDWEIINEPDISYSLDRKPLSPDEYVKLAKECYTIIKEIDPGLKVLCASITDRDFMESALKADAGKYCDIWNIHIYSRSDPEFKIPEYVEGWKKLFEKYDLSDRPLWVTESGRTTNWRYPLNFVFALVLERLKIDPMECGLLTISEPRLNIGSEMMTCTAEDIGIFKEVREIAMKEAGSIDVKKFPVLLAPVAQVPRDGIDGLYEYVKKGGTVIFPGDVPLYSERYLDQDGNPAEQQVNKKLLSRFHIDWDAWWTVPGKEKEIPRLMDMIVPAPGFGQAPILDYKRYCRGADSGVATGIRQLKATNLKGGDRFVPVLLASWKNGKKYPVAGLYQFDSELKGNIFIFTPWHMAFQFPHSRDSQARLLARDILLAKGNGVGTFFEFKLTEIGENSHPEHWYGLCDRNLRPKPAFYAYQTLIRECPAGSSTVKLTDYGNDIWQASWKRPDGKFVHAVWSRVRPKPARLTWTGKIETICDYLGKPVFPPDSREFTITSGVTYFTGPEKLTVAPLTK